MKLSKITVSFFLLFLSFTVVKAQNDQSPESGDKDIRIIEIEGSDQMKFDVTEINATPGEKIKIQLTTISNLPKAAMAHNVVILKRDTNVKSFANASASARDNDFIASEYTDQIIASTPLAGGGETVEVTFTVPEETGSYTYICTFPGHYSAGMKGTLVVEN